MLKPPQLQVPLPEVSQPGRKIGHWSGGLLLPVLPRGLELLCTKMSHRFYYAWGPSLSPCSRVVNLL